MIICDLEHLEVVGEENRIEGGVQLVSASSASSSGAATDGRVFTSNGSSSSASQQPFLTFGFFGPIVVGTTTQTSANASASGSTFRF
ncbi:MAG TPA: hypothetical protein V6D30_15815 [Leptolyngbyaceae cyanobacterium]